MAKNEKQFQVQDGTQFKMNYEVIPGVLPETTLFIHGNLASNRWWYPASEVWEKQSQRKLEGSMILAEFRGCGKSSAPRAASEVTMDRLAQDYLDLVAHLGLKQVNVVGHSTGGLIAAAMAAKSPGTVQKMVLLDPVGAKGVKFDPSMTEAFEQMKTNKELVGLVIGSTIHQNNPETDFFRQVVVEDAFRAVQTVGLQILKALDGLDLTAQISSINTPCLVLHGEFDQLLSVADSQALAQLQKQGQFEVFRGVGHCGNVENPSRFVERVNQFLF
ncbi:MAG: alpha/beta hydrolase [Proteobacteria bacterium]|jgi:pimeloyl-ACP methyl ester carboxylesterase|nr:alpha/beta hydrolase [Pseudomonadota bacterium]